MRRANRTVKTFSSRTAAAVRPSDQAWFAEAQATFETARPEAEVNDPVLVVLGELLAAAQKQSPATSG